MGNRVRANGEGSVSKRAEGKWLLRVVLTHPLTGNPVRKSKVFLTKTKRDDVARREAERELASWRVVAERELASEVRGGGETLSTLADDWLEHLASTGTKAPTTLLMYRRHLDNHVLPTLGVLPVRDIGARQLDTLYAQLVKGTNGKRALSPSTVETIHWVVSSMLRQAKRWEMIDKLPEPTVPTPDTAEVEPPTPEQVQALVDTARKLELPHIAMLIRLAALTGARRGELCGLQVSDLDWDGGTLKIQRQLQVEVGVVPPKGKKARVVALGPGLVTELQDYLGAERDQLGERSGPWLFSCDGGETPLDPRRVSEAINRVGKACGVAVHTHSLRHFHDTYLMAAGVDDVTIAKRAGHSTEMARRTYMHRVSEADVRAAQTLETILAGEHEETAAAS